MTENPFLNVANALTVLRLLLSPVLLFLAPLSVSFIAVYLVCGLSDMADGCIARKTHCETPLGAKLDSAADLVFAAVCLVKILPLLSLSRLCLLAVSVVILIRVLNLILGLMLCGRIVMLHSLPNKLAGLMLFLFPLSIKLIDVNISSALVCLIALLASTHESIEIIRIEKHG